MAETKAPPRDLFFDYVFEGTASQTTTIEVLGESATSPTRAADEIITVNIEVSEANALLTVGVQGTTGIGYPSLIFSLAGIDNARLTPKYDLFKTVSQVSSGDQFQDDAGVMCDSLQKVFSGQQFDFNVANPLSRIPVEAIKSVDYSGALDVKNYNGDSVTRLVFGSDGTLGLIDRTITAGNDEDLGPDPKAKAVRSLYLQALAADRYKDTALPGATGGNELSQGASQGFDFLNGDTISLYTNLVLTKTREFIPDQSALSGVVQSSGKRFFVDGSDVVIGANDSGENDVTDDSYTSQPKEWLVQWKLVVS